MHIYIYIYIYRLLKNIYIYIVFNNLKFTLERLKRSYMFRSSSGCLRFSLLKLQFKTLSDLFRYINLVLWQHVVCCV